MWKKVMSPQTSLFWQTADTIDQSLTDRAKRQVRLIYVFAF